MYIDLHCISGNIHVSILICVLYYLHIDLLIHIYIHIHICIYICIYLWIYVFIYVYMQVCMYVCMHACMYVCMCIYTRPTSPACQVKEPDDDMEEILVHFEACGSCPKNHGKFLERSWGSFEDFGVDIRQV